MILNMYYYIYGDNKHLKILTMGYNIQYSIYYNSYNLIYRICSS